MGQLLNFSNKLWSSSGNLLWGSAKFARFHAKDTLAQLAKNYTMKSHLNENQCNGIQTSGGGRFRTARAQHVHSSNYYVVSPGNTPENHRPTEACMVNSKQHGVKNSGNWDPWKASD